MHEPSNFCHVRRLSILNSKLIKNFWLSKYCDGKQLFPKIKGFQLNEVPIKISNLESQFQFRKLGQEMINLNLSIYQHINKFLSRIQSNLQVENITGKLEKFYEHDFKTFVGELKKQKIVLSLKDQDEWDDYFHSYKNDINQIQSEIQKTDNEIDQMVYELYGLTDDEIKVVEGN